MIVCYVFKRCNSFAIVCVCLLRCVWFLCVLTVVFYVLCLGSVLHYDVRSVLLIVVMCCCFVVRMCFVGVLCV